MAIAPHGGALVNRFVPGGQREEYRRRASSLPTIRLSRRQISDLELIAIGAVSPLKGFMGKADYESVVTRMRLSNGLPWSIPVTLPVGVDQAESARPGREITLADESGNPLAILTVSEVYGYDKQREAAEVYRTTEE